RQIAELQGLSPDADVDDPASLADDEVGCGQNRLRSGKLRKLYRDVCRKFHPDLSADEQEREHRHRLMIEINRAYETGSEERLRALLEAGANIEVTGSVTELVLLTRLTAQARERLIAIEEEIADITASETWQLKLRAENAEAVGADLLADLVAQVERQIKKACNRLEALQSVMLTACRALTRRFAGPLDTHSRAIVELQHFFNPSFSVPGLVRQLCGLPCGLPTDGWGCHSSAIRAAGR